MLFASNPDFLAKNGVAECKEAPKEGPFRDTFGYLARREGQRPFHYQSRSELKTMILTYNGRAFETVSADYRSHYLSIGAERNPLEEALERRCDA